MYLIGYDIGSSSIKATLMEAETGKVVADATSPAKEMEITAARPGWAEQRPEETMKVRYFGTERDLLQCVS